MTTAWKRLTVSLAVLLYCSSGAFAEKLSVGNAAISVTVDTDDGTMSVTDKRTGQTWRQNVLAKGKAADVRQVADGIDMT